MENYGKIAKYWDDIQESKIVSKLQAREFDGLLRKFGVKTILELGCGTGLLLTNLSQLGYECTGVDLDKDMLEIAKSKAREQNLKIHYMQDDIRELKLGGKFDAVICLQVLSLLLHDNDIETAFRSVSQLLEPGGIFLFNVLNAEFINKNDPYLNSTPFVDIVLDRGKYKLLRMNTMKIKDNVQRWDAVYFIEEDNKLSMNIHNNTLRLFHLHEIDNFLRKHNLMKQTIMYRNIENIEKINMVVTALRE